MNIEQYDLFPTMVMVIKDFISEEARQSMLDFARKTPKGNHRSLSQNCAASSHGYDSDSRPFPIINAVEEISNNYPPCADFVDDLLDALSVYCGRSGMSPVGIKNSWVNIQSPNSELRAHRHAGSAISGALYIQVDDDSSHIYFDNPNPYIQFNNNKTDTPYSFEWYRFKPENNMLILFPGWLSHGSKGELNKSHERVVLSFNTWWQ